MAAFRSLKSCLEQSQNVALDACILGLLCPITFLWAGATLWSEAHGITEEAPKKFSLLLGGTICFIFAIPLAWAIFYVSMNLPEFKGTFSIESPFWWVAVGYLMVAALTGSVIYVTISKK